MSHLKFTVLFDFMLYTDGNVHPDLSKDNWVSKPAGGAVFGFGIEGFRDRVQLSSHEASFYPAVPSQSFLIPNFNETMKLEKEYTDFFDKHERVVLISFGTMFMPPIEEMDLIIEAIKLTDPKVLGFIISMKEYAPSYEGIKELNLPNILLKTHVP